MLNYLIQSTLLWGLFALVYHTTLRRETFFALNRTYLLLASLCGVLLPLVGSFLPQTGVPTLTLPVVELLPAQVAGQNAAGFDIAFWFTVLYATGAAFGAIRLATGLTRIALLIRDAEHETTSDGSILVHTDRVNMPFSFFHWIVVPRHFSSDPALLRSMLAHERAHVYERHSLDVLFFEILSIVFWFNPLVYYFRSHMRHVHEFQADAEASGETGAKQYGHWLLEQAGLPAARLVLANHFYQSPLRQRLTMMVRTPSHPLRKLKYLLFFPLMLGMLFQVGAAPAPEGTADKTVVPAEFPGGMLALMHFLAQKIHYPDEAKAQKLEAVVVLEVVLDEDGKVQEVNNLSAGRTPAPHPEMVAEATRAVWQMPAWKPATSAGKPVATKTMIPIKFKLQ